MTNSQLIKNSFDTNAITGTGKGGRLNPEQAKRFISYMTDNTDYRVTAVSTAASKANIQSIGDGDYQIGFTQSDVMNYA